MLTVLLAAMPLISAPEAPFVEKPVELETPALVLKADRIEAGTKALTWQNRERARLARGLTPWKENVDK